MKRGNKEFETKQAENNTQRELKQEERYKMWGEHKNEVGGGG